MAVEWMQGVRVALLQSMLTMPGFRQYLQVIRDAVCCCFLIFNICFLDPNYAVDPLNPLFQRTPGMQQVLQASQSKRLKPKAFSNSTATAPNVSATAGGMSAELKLLVSSVKSKAPRA